MIVWDRNSQYRTKLSSEDREEIAFNISTPTNLKKAEKWNTAINIIVPIITFLIFDLNIIAFGISFILTDLILCFADQMIYVKIPYTRNQKMSLDDVQKRIDKLKKKKDDLSAELEKFRDKECRECRYYYYNSCTDCRSVKIAVNEIRILNDFIVQEEEYLKSELEKIKEKEIETNNKKSKDYSNKKQYLIDIRDKLKYYKSKKGMDFLAPTLKSVKTLISTLDKKPVGYNLISNTLYIYLDELQNILGRLETLEDSKREKYVADIEKISVALSENIDNLINRITKLETEDLEVSITVLLNELNRKEDEDNV